MATGRKVSPTILPVHHRRDCDAYRLYTQLSTNMPDNVSSLELLRNNSFYDLYWIMTSKIFNKYGQSSLRAEAEIFKVVMVPIVYREGHLPRDNSPAALYQLGKKKLYIVLNEVARARNKGDRNPACIATGHDRHVKKFSKFFTPYENFNDRFTRLLCQLANDWIKWNFNEIVGELQQCLKARRYTAKNNFAIHVVRDLVVKYPQYKNMMMSFVTSWQWKEITATSTNVTEGNVRQTVT